MIVSCEAVRKLEFSASLCDFSDGLGGQTSGAEPSKNEPKFLRHFMQRLFLDASLGSRSRSHDPGEGTRGKPQMPRKFARKMKFAGEVEAFGQLLVRDFLMHEQFRAHVELSAMPILSWGNACKNAESSAKNVIAAAKGSGHLLQ